AVSEYAATLGLDKVNQDFRGYWAANWGSNEHGLLALAQAPHYWDNTDGVIRAIMVMSFDGALGYPADPTDLAGDYMAVEIGDTIAFDIKSNATVGGTEGDNKVEYFWASDKNQGYAANYYSGHLILKGTPEPAATPAFSGVSWVNWNLEPDYADVTGYADNPYDNPEVTIKKAPASWTPVSDVASFDVTWSILGDSMAVANLTSNGVAGDLFDLGSGTPSFGAAWKGVHDGANFYVLLKYWDVNTQADAGSYSFEIMAQPTSPVRHEYSFEAASDSAEAAVLAYQNMAYCRMVELGGGKAVFKDGAVSEYAGTLGLSKVNQDFRGYWAANWGSNEHGLLALAQAAHFWDNTDGVIRAVMVMSFDGALGYPVDYTNLEGDYSAIQVGETFAFDVKSNATVGGTEGDNKVEYFWASDKNQGYAANYYSGHLTLSDEEIVVVGVRDRVASNLKVYIHNDYLNITGVEVADVDIYSITGSRVKSIRNVTGPLNVSDLNNGIYIVKLKGISTGFKVVK
ncbi:MAG: T9SS type A sorting domain-containing protein, partial [Bacteroidales bacterium]